MKKTKTLLLTALLTLTLSTFLTGCSTASQEKSNNILKIGATPVPHSEILEFAKPLLEKEGIQLEVEVFTDYVLPNTALENGDLDANFFQHKPYLDSFNENNGTHIVSVAAIHFEPLGIYPGKVASLSELSKGNTVAIPNDVTNEARALLLLQSLDLITLDSSKGLEATIQDITSNPYELQFKELEAATLPRTLDDVDFAVINGNYALDAGIAKTVLAAEQTTSEGAQTFANILATGKDSVNTDKIQTLIKVLQSDDVKNFINEQYEGAIIPSF